VGLAARFLEEAHFSTVVLTPTHEFHRGIGVPRTAAIEYPYGRPIGQVGDREGQREVLLKVLELLENGPKPGELLALPFRWPENPKETNWHPPEMSPIVRAYIKEIKAARRGEAGKQP
jgi:hypothetical protein